MGTCFGNKLYLGCSRGSEEGICHTWKERTPQFANSSISEKRASLGWLYFSRFSDGASLNDNPIPEKDPPTIFSRRYRRNNFSEGSNTGSSGRPFLLILVGRLRA